MRQIHILVILLLIPAWQVQAQDSHYWDNQYGTAGELLGGVVVGTPNDLSATFYNPGWIPLQIDPGLLLTTVSVEGYSIKLKDPLGDGADPVSNSVTISPGYLAGRFSTGEDKTWHWAYSFLQKVKFQFNPVGITIDSFESTPPGNPIQFSGEALRVSEVNEYWYGLTFARKIHPNAGLGFTPYVVQRSMKSRTQAAAQGLDASGDFGQAYLVDKYDFWHVRLLAKIGLAVEQGNLTYGLTLTTPGLGLLGSGKVLTTDTTSGLDQDDDGIVDPPYLSSNFQEDLSASWQSPLSVAAGVSLKSGSSAYHFTMEWFNAVQTQQAMNPDSFTSQSDPAETRDYNLAFGAKSLINFGVAYQHSFPGKMAIFAAFRSDFSSIPSKDADNLQISNWDLWHLSGGASFNFLDMEFTAGLQYSTGSGTSERFINFNVSESGIIPQETETFDIRYRRLKAIIGFNLPFGTPEGE